MTPPAQASCQPLSSRIFLPRGGRTPGKGALPMGPQSNLPMTDRPCPLAFVVVPAFVSGLIWVYVLLLHMTAP